MAVTTQNMACPAAATSALAAGPECLKAVRRFVHATGRLTGLSVRVRRSAPDAVTFGDEQALRIEWRLPTTAEALWPEWTLPDVEDDDGSDERTSELSGTLLRHCRRTIDALARNKALARAYLEHE